MLFLQMIPLLLMNVQANQVRPETPGTPDEMVITMELGESALDDDTPQKKPAILGSEGTSVKVSFTTRPPKQPMPSTLKRRYRGGNTQIIFVSLLKLFHFV